MPTCGRYHADVILLIHLCRIKVRDRFSNETYYFRINSEISTLLRCNHENVVKIIGWSSSADLVVIVTEYMPGRSLERLMMRRENVPHIPFALRLQFCADISKGVDYLHYDFDQNRIVHGDIKPANILLTDKLRCKVADFGSAKLAKLSEKVSQQESREKYTQQTVGYVAPERKDFKKRLSRAMDVFSVGATFYLIQLREDPPEEYRNIDLDDKLNSPFDPNNEKEENEHFNLLKRLMLDCYKRNPDQRKSVREVKESLDQHMESCGACDTAHIAQNVASVLNDYKVNSCAANFSKSSLLSNCLYKNFEYKSKLMNSSPDDSDWPSNSN